MNAPVALHDLRREAARPQPGHAAGLRLALLHIPKTAGTAFGAALAQRFAEREIAGTRSMALASGAADPGVAQVARDFRLLGVGSHLDHDALDAIAAGLPWGERLFTATVLRDPRTRLISQYRHWRRTGDAELVGTPDEYRDAYLAARRLPLVEFLTAGIPFVDLHFRNFQARMLCGLASSELMDDATLLSTARAHLAGLDVVGTTEALDDAMARIAEAYGWSQPDSVRALNVAPAGWIDELHPATQALLHDYTRIDRILWEEAQGTAGAAPTVPARPARRYYRPDPALLATVLDGTTVRFAMGEALDGQGWHVREGAESLARWTGPGRRSTVLLRAPLLRQLDVALTLVSVLDWTMVEGAVLTLDGVPPAAPPRVHQGVGVDPVLLASFVLPDEGTGRRQLAIEVPFTRSHLEFDPNCGDDRQKGMAIGDITLSAQPGAGPATLGALFWPGEAWSETPPDGLVDLLTIVRKKEVPPAPRNMSFDLPLLTAILDHVAPDHVWAAARFTFLTRLQRGAPLALPAPPGRLAVVATLFEIPGRGGPIATLAERFEHAVLLLPCAEDFRLRALAESPLLAPHLHIVGCTNAILVANLSGLRAAGGKGLLETFLLLLERIATTTPEKLGMLRDEFGATYPLRQLDAVLRGMEALCGGRSTSASTFATLMLGPPASQPPQPADLPGRLAALAPALGLVDPALVADLRQLIDGLATTADGQQALSYAVASHHQAFRIASLLVGWDRFGLGSNATALLAATLRADKPAPPLYPKPLKPFREYIDYYRGEARVMSLQKHSPTLTTALQKLGGGLDHVVRLHQAAREIELALRLLGDRHPGEEILWVDAGCSYGVLCNAVETPANIRGRFSVLGFDFNAPAIDMARMVAANLGHGHCRFEVGDVAEARALANGRRIHLITAFEVLEHCPDPVAVLRDYRAMDPGMLVVGSPLTEAQSIFPAEQHVWGWDAHGFAAMAEAAGFALLGLNQRHVGKFVGGHDWVTVTAFIGDPTTMITV